LANIGQISSPEFVACLMENREENAPRWQARQPPLAKIIGQY
jgi:hypothetical protein